MDNLLTGTLGGLLGDRTQQHGFRSMNINISGKQIDLGDALRQHISERLEAKVAKYFDHAIEANVVLRREGAMFQCECKVHVGAGITAVAEGQANEIYPAADAAIERLEKQLRRDKRERRNHHASVPPRAADLG